jgi:ubiquitin carboxyl-terminal hydrolase 6/32
VSLLFVPGTTGYAYVSNLPTPPKRYLAYVAAFSRMATVKQVYDFLCSRLRIRPEDMRLWHYRDEVSLVNQEVQFKLYPSHAKSQ